jgi:multicomponent Na+:H+ antiporter subunit E
MTVNDAPKSGTPQPAHEPKRSGSTRTRTIALVALLSLFWFLLSGRIGLQYFIFMVGTVGLVVLMNPERPFGSRAVGMPQGGAEWIRSGVALLRHLVWLLRSVIVANLDVARRILDPRMPIRPMFMVFRTDLKSEVAQVMFGNTITLTPGTVTVDLKDGTLLVHALHPDTASAVISGEVQNTIAPIFGEPRQPAPEVRWTLSARELLDVDDAAQAEFIPVDPEPEP